MPAAFTLLGVLLIIVAIPFGLMFAPLALGVLFVALAWRHVVARHIALRLGCEPDDLVPLTIGHMALGTSMAAFVRWVAHPEEDLEAHLERGYRMLSQVLLPE